MSPTRLTALAFALTALMLITTGCGKSASSKDSASSSTTAQTPTNTQSTTTPKTSTHLTITHTGPLTRTQLIAEANTICSRLNARRSTTVIRNQQDFERVVPALVAYELAGATEMSKLTPPASLTQSWHQVITGTRTIAEATGHTYVEETSGPNAKTIDVSLGNGIKELVDAAKHIGLNECAQFQ